MNRALQKASSDEIRLAKLKRKHESVVRDRKPRMNQKEAEAYARSLFSPPATPTEPPTDVGKHEAFVRDGKKYAGPSRTWPGQGATVSFSVLVQEPMTKDERALVREGIDIDPLPVLKRWAARDKRNKLKDVLYVEQATKPVTAAHAMALAQCHNDCQRKFRKRK